MESTVKHATARERTSVRVVIERSRLITKHQSYNALSPADCWQLLMIVLKQQSMKSSSSDAHKSTAVEISPAPQQIGFSTVGWSRNLLLEAFTVDSDHQTAISTTIVSRRTA